MTQAKALSADAGSLSRFRSHLPKIGIGFLVVLLGLFLYLIDWDVSKPSFVVGRKEYYFIVLICMTIAPGYAYGLYLYHKDRYYNESWRLLGKLFLYGVLLTPLASLGEYISSVILNYDYDTDRATITEHFVFYFFIVGVMEELVKFLVVWKIAYPTKWFKQVYDGMLFCAASSLGFATIENIGYVFSAGEEGLYVALARSLTSIPSHLSYGIVIGYGMGKAKATPNPQKRKEWLTIGLAGAVFLHGAYDFLIVVYKNWFFIPLMIAGWIIAFVFLKKGLAYTPFTYCSNCRKVIPQLASHCPFCGKAHKILLSCWSCGAEVTKWTRKCMACYVRMRFPWHLQVDRIKDLYAGRNFIACKECEEEIPSEKYCLHCGHSLAKSSARVQ